MTDWAKVREILWERCGGRCEVSGQPLDFDTFDAHHRRNKGMGGTSRPDKDRLTNLLALDPIVHNGGPASVHGRRRWSEARGYLIPKHAEKLELWPVWLPLGRNARGWKLLGLDGRYHDLPFPLAGPGV
jgi:hypothetical protein